MEKTSKEYLFDSRLTERHINQKKISQEELDAHINALPDVTDKGLASPLEDYATGDLPPVDGHKDIPASNS